MKARLLNRDDIGIAKLIWFRTDDNAEHEDFPGILDYRIFGQTLNVTKDSNYDIYFAETVIGKIVIEPWMIAKLIKPKLETVEEILKEWK